MPQTPDSFRAYATGATSGKVLFGLAPITVAASGTVQTVTSNVLSGSADITAKGVGFVFQPVTRTISASVDHTGATDVTAAVQAFLDAAPDGSVALMQPGGTYRCDKPLFIQHCSNVTWDLNGSTIVKVDPCPYAAASANTTVGAANDGLPVQTTTTLAVADASGLDPFGVVFVFDTFGTGTVSPVLYSGITSNTLTGCRSRFKADEIGTYHSGARVVQPTEQLKHPQFSNEASGDNTNDNIVVSPDVVNVTIRNGTITGGSKQSGPNPRAYITDVEYQAGIIFYGVNGYELNNVTIQHVFGDLIYFSDGGHPMTANNLDGIIVNCTLTGSGRIGLSPISVRGLEITGGSIGNTRRAIFDYEPVTGVNRCLDFNVHDMTIGAHGLLFFSGSGGISQVPFLGSDQYAAGNITFHNLTSNDDFSLEFYDAADLASARRGPFTMTNCTSTYVYGGGNGYEMQFHGVDGVTVTNNVLPLQVRNNPTQRLAHAHRCTAVNVTANTLAPSPSDANHEVTID